MRSIVIFTSFIALTIKLSAQSGEVFFSKPVKLGKEVNSACDESSPVLSRDGKTMYFTRVYCAENTGGEKAGQDIWYSKRKEDGSWTTALKLSKNINNRFDNAPYAVDENGNLYISSIYLKTGYMAPGISMIKPLANDSLFSDPEPVIIKNARFKPNSFLSIALSPKGNVMILSKAKKEYTDPEDLFVSFKGDSGWSEPVNMGLTLNTIGYETSPFIADDDSTIYFSSNGHPGEGEGDIFMSRRTDESWLHWTKPENLGNKINSTGFDGFFSILPSGEAYFISGDNPKSPGDIFTTHIIKSYVPVNVKVIDEKTKLSINNCTITSFVSRDPAPIEQQVALNGAAVFRLKNVLQRYTFVVHAPGYLSSDETLDFLNYVQSSDTGLTISLKQPKIGQTIKLNHIYFETGKAELLAESHFELETLSEMLKSNPGMKILIAGHTDNVGEHKNNVQLSNDRVRTVVDWLIAEGVEKERLQYKGYGESKPLASNTTEEGRAKNRRVEFVILKK